VRLLDVLRAARDLIVSGRRLAGRGAAVAVMGLWGLLPREEQISALLLVLVVTLCPVCGGAGRIAGARRPSKIVRKSEKIFLDVLHAIFSHLHAWFLAPEHALRRPLDRVRVSDLILVLFFFLAENAFDNRYYVCETFLKITIFFVFRKSIGLLRVCGQATSEVLVLSSSNPIPCAWLEEACVVWIREMDKGKTNIQRDWEQREFIEDVTVNIKKVTEFLNRFGILPFFFTSVLQSLTSPCLPCPLNY
jgi:hypothetical protein